MSIVIRSSKSDKVVCTLDRSGAISISSTWKLLRQKKNSSIIDTKIWNKAIPFNMAFLTWRVVYDKMLIDERISRIGYSMSTKHNTKLRFASQK